MPRLLGANLQKPPTLLQKFLRRREDFFTTLDRSELLDSALLLPSQRKLLWERAGFAYRLSDLFWCQREVLSDEALVSKSPMEEFLAFYLWRRHDVEAALPGPAPSK
jgi:hypothetical protein